MKKIFILIIIIAGLTSCRNVFLFKYRPFFKEYNRIDNTSYLTIHQGARYNVRWIMDEEYWYELKTVFLDTTLAKEKRILDVSKDTNIVRCHYGFYSIWMAHNKPYKLSGTIKIIKWQHGTIILKMNIRAAESFLKKTVSFKGVRKINVKIKD